MQCLYFCPLSSAAGISVDVLKRRHRKSVARCSAETDSSKLATDANLTGEKRCDHLLSSFPKCRLYITAADHSDSRLLELICYSWDFYTCHNLLVFPPAMWLRCEALRFSLWSVSHFKTEVIFSSVFPVSAWFFFILYPFALFCFPLFCQKPLTCLLTPLPHHVPQTEDSTQLLISADATYSTVTNGMWASCLPRPLPVSGPQYIWPVVDSHFLKRLWLCRPRVWAPWFCLLLCFCLYFCLTHFALFLRETTWWSRGEQPEQR